MIKHWGAIESDFQRQYNINLRTEIHTISWDRLNTLIQNLHPDSSTFALLVQQEQEDMKKRKEEDAFTPDKLLGMF